MSTWRCQCSKAFGCGSYVIKYFRVKTRQLSFLRSRKLANQVVQLSKTECGRGNVSRIFYAAKPAMQMCFCVLKSVVETTYKHQHQAQYLPHPLAYPANPWLQLPLLASSQ